MYDSTYKTHDVIRLTRDLTLTNNEWMMAKVKTKEEDPSSKSVQFGDDDDSECLIKGGTDGQTQFVRMPIKGTDRLSRKSYVVHQMDLKRGRGGGGSGKR